MARSQRGLRSPARNNEDSGGNVQFPAQPGHTYDWAGIWPGGSGGEINPSTSRGGITLVVAGLPANDGTLTVTGTATEVMAGAVILDSDAVGTPVVERADFSIAIGDDATTIATSIADAIAVTVSHLAVNTLGVVDFNLQGAGTINSAVVILDS